VRTAVCIGGTLGLGMDGAVKYSITSANYRRSVEVVGFGVGQYAISQVLDFMYDMPTPKDIIRIRQRDKGRQSGNARERWVRALDTTTQAPFEGHRTMTYSNRDVDCK